VTAIRPDLTRMPAGVVPPDAAPEVTERARALRATIEALSVPGRGGDRDGGPRVLLIIGVDIVAGCRTAG